MPTKTRPARTKPARNKPKIVIVTLKPKDRVSTNFLHRTRSLATLPSLLVDSASISPLYFR